MIISITGTPGTGKSHVAKALAKQLNANLIEIKKLVDTNKVPYIIDKKRQTKTVEIKELQKAVNKNIVKGKPNIIEGHLSHLLRSDMVIILRTDPVLLKHRLKKRKWSEAKIKENHHAEILGIITQEAMQRSRVFEIDTSRQKPSVVSSIIAKLLNNHSARKYRVGNIDWSEHYKKELLK